MASLPDVISVWIVVHCIQPLNHPQMVAVLRRTAELFRVLKQQGFDVFVATPGGFADFDLEYAVGNKPVHTGLWLKRQLVALGVPEDCIVEEPLFYQPENNICDTSTEARAAAKAMESRVDQIVLPMNGPHGRRGKRSWQFIMGTRVPIHVDKVRNRMGLKWTVLDCTVRWILWWFDPLCEKFPSRKIIEGRRVATAGIDRAEALRRTERGDYDLKW